MKNSPAAIAFAFLALIGVAWTRSDASAVGNDSSIHQFVAVLKLSSDMKDSDCPEATQQLVTILSDYKLILRPQVANEEQRYQWDTPEPIPKNKQKTSQSEDALTKELMECGKKSPAVEKAMNQIGYSLLASQSLQSFLNSPAVRTNFDPATMNAFLTVAPGSVPPRSPADSVKRVDDPVAKVLKQELESALHELSSLAKQALVILILCACFLLFLFFAVLFQVRTNQLWDKRFEELWIDYTPHWKAMLEILGDQQQALDNINTLIRRWVSHGDVPAQDPTIHAPHKSSVTRSTEPTSPRAAIATGNTTTLQHDRQAEAHGDVPAQDPTIHAPHKSSVTRSTEPTSPGAAIVPVKRFDSPRIVKMANLLANYNAAIQGGEIQAFMEKIEPDIVWVKATEDGRTLVVVSDPPTDRNTVDFFHCEDVQDRKILLPGPNFILRRAAYGGKEALTRVLSPAYEAVPGADFVVKEVALGEISKDNTFLVKKRGVIELF